MSIVSTVLSAAASLVRPAPVASPSYDPARDRAIVQSEPELRAERDRLAQAMADARAAFHAGTITERALAIASEKLSDAARRLNEVQHARQRLWSGLPHYAPDLAERREDFLYRRAAILRSNTKTRQTLADIDERLVLARRAVETVSRNIEQIGRNHPDAVGQFESEKRVQTDLRSLERDRAECQSILDAGVSEVARLDAERASIIEAAING